MRDFDRAIVEEFRANGGRVGGVLEGTPLMLLHHVGARSGVARVTPLVCTVRNAGEYLIVASNGGAAAHPAWYYNLKTRPSVTVEFGAETFPATATELEGAERAAVWPGLLAASPSLRAFAAKAGREIPVFALTRRSVESGRMDLELQDRVAVVTGAGKGIGRAVVDALLAEGAVVVAGARHVDSLEGLDRVTPLAVDLAAPDGPGQLVALAVERYGRVDVLVNNVGAAPIRLDGFLALTDADFDATMQLNFYAALRATRAAVADMLGRDEPGAIVNVASVNAFFQPDGGVIDYGAAKAALVNVAKALSQELAPRGIRINNVSPGPVETDLWLGDQGVAATIGRATGADPAAVRDQMIAGGIPTGRFSTPAEVATLVVLLASDRTANVTGSSFVIDGGLIKTT